jgi:hypothetical protein
MRTYEQIEKTMLFKNYVFDNRPNFANFIWERTSDEVTNKFTDFLHVAYNLQVLSIPATTKAGSNGAFYKPPTVEGLTGTAVIIPNQYLKTHKFKDTIQEFSTYPYFRQIAPIDYWRDGNKDLKIDRVQLQKQKIFGTHWHRMSQNDTYGSGLVNNWSEGCMGSPEPEFKKIIPIVREHLAYYGDLHTLTLLETKDFI